jgi:hypothetical protein
MLASIHNLREISRCCLTGEQLDNELSNWLGASLVEFLERRSPTIDKAFGLEFPRGGVPWWMEEAIRKRDAALRQLAARYLADHSLSERSRQIRRLSCRYAASAWRQDRNRDEMPERYAGTPKECLWRAFRSGAPMPLSERQLRNILAC